MRIVEIEIINPQMDPGIAYDQLPPLLPWKKAKVVNIPLLHADTGDTQHVFAIKNSDGVIMATVVCRDYPVISGKAVLQILRTWVEPEYRNKGYATAMYNTLYNQGYSIMSDNDLAPASIAIWQRFNKQRKVYQFDTKKLLVSVLSSEINSDPDLVYFMESQDGSSGEPLPRFRNNNNYFLTENNLFLGTDAP